MYCQPIVHNPSTQIWPVEYVNELNKTLRTMLGNGAELKKKAAAKWQAFYKIQAKPVKPNAPEQVSMSTFDL